MKKSNTEEAKTLIDGITSTPHFKGPLDDWDLRIAQAKLLLSIAESLETLVQIVNQVNPTGDR